MPLISAASAFQRFLVSFNCKTRELLFKIPFCPAILRKHITDTFRCMKTIITHLQPPACLFALLL